MKISQQISELPEFPLHDAVEKNDFQLFRSLLNSTTIDLNAKNQDGMTALMLAKKQNKTKMVNCFLQLHRAVSDNNHEVLKWSLKRLNPNIEDEYGNTVLHNAVSAGRFNDHNRYNMVQSLLEDGRSDLSKKDSYGSTPLHKAAQSCDAKMVKLLLRYNKTSIDVVNGVGETALMMAAKRGDIDIVQLLLENDANLHIKSKYDDTALAIVMANKDIPTEDKQKIIKLFIEAGFFNDLSKTFTWGPFCSLALRNLDLFTDLVMKARDDLNLSELNDIKYCLDDIHLPSVKKQQELANHKYAKKIVDDAIHQVQDDMHTSLADMVLERVVNSSDDNHRKIKKLLKNSIGKTIKERLNLGNDEDLVEDLFKQVPQDLKIQVQRKVKDLTLTEVLPQTMADYFYEEGDAITEKNLAKPLAIKLSEKKVDAITEKVILLAIERLLHIELGLQESSDTDEAEIKPIIAKEIQDFSSQNEGDIIQKEVGISEEYNDF